MAPATASTAGSDEEQRVDQSGCNVGITDTAEVEVEFSRCAGGVEESGQELEQSLAFPEPFDEQGFIPSPWINQIQNPVSAINFLIVKYNDLMGLYNSTKNRCRDECEPRYTELKKRYTNECLERRQLYNELVELRGNIRVFCRCRPLAPDETTKGSLSVIEFDPSHDADLRVLASDGSKKPFKFDHVFSPSDTQEAVFAQTVPIVRSVMDGYNVCIFAYGQTGTGKTFTMEGTPENRGVNYRALEELFIIANQRDSTLKYTFYVSILEVYNEKIKDLLADCSDPHIAKLEVKQANDGSHDVPGLVETQVYTVDDVWDKLKAGANNRSVGATHANEISSRSHLLVRVTVKSVNCMDGQRRKCHLWLVDLAGSERVGKTEAEGERLKESQFINKSLSALGDVISALASKNPHIPYRNSKLTHLLQSSLGGDCKTLMFVQISPSSADLAETMCSLNFALRVRGIENGPARKQVDATESFKLKQMNEKLQKLEKENSKLNDSLQLIQLKYATRENAFKSLQDKVRETEEACKNHQKQVKDLESQLLDERKSTKGMNIGRIAKPPLAPMKRRTPLSTISNLSTPSGASRMSISRAPGTLPKENTPQLSKAHRVSLSLAPLVWPPQPKGRSSLAGPERFQLPPIQERKLGFQVGARRRSVASFGTLAPTPSVAGKLKSFEQGSYARKFSSPGMASRIPLRSPRQRLHLVATPASKKKQSDNDEQIQQASPASKLVFNVQKRLTVAQPSFLEQLAAAAVRERQMARLGGARRVLVNRRKSFL